MIARLSSDHKLWFVLYCLCYSNKTYGRWSKSLNTSGDVGTNFGWFFWSADDFFVEAPKLKVSLSDPPIFRGFVVGDASGDGRPMIGRQSADFLKIFSSCCRPKVARSSGVNRPTISSLDGRSMTFPKCCPIVGRWTADDRPMQNRSDPMSNQLCIV